MEKKDKTIICKDCGKEFVFTAGEQEYFEKVLGFTNDPVRCKECREKRKVARNNNRRFEDNNNRN